MNQAGHEQVAARGMIPLRPGVDSLNVAVPSEIAFYEKVLPVVEPLRKPARAEGRAMWQIVDSLVGSARLERRLRDPTSRFGTFGCWQNPVT